MSEQVRIVVSANHITY